MDETWWKPHDRLLRAGGLVLVLLGAAAGRGLPVSGNDTAAQLLAYLLAAVAFAGISIGLALLVLGARIADQIRIASPWQSSPTHAQPALPSAPKEMPAAGKETVSDRESLPA